MPLSAAIVLAGGGSTRMGTPKACLEWHGSTLLRRVVGIVARVVDGPVVVVSAPGHALPGLPAAVEVVEDAVPGQGPLFGLGAGLAAVRDRCEVTYVTATDAPFLYPGFVARVLEGCSDGVDICVPEVGGFLHPLGAAYRPSVVPLVEALLAGGARRLGRLVEEGRTRRVQPAWLLADPVVSAGDPRLDSLHNLNRPDDYCAAAARPEPEVSVERSGFGRVLVRASNLAGAAEAAGVRLHGSVVLNGSLSDPDPELPLVAGDTLVLGPATPGSRAP